MANCTYYRKQGCVSGKPCTWKPSGTNECRWSGVLIPVPVGMASEDKDLAQVGIVKTKELEHYRWALDKELEVQHYVR